MRWASPARQAALIAVLNEETSGGAHVLSLISLSVSSAAGHSPHAAMTALHVQVSGSCPAARIWLISASASACLPALPHADIVFAKLLALAGAACASSRAMAARQSPVWAASVNVAALVAPVARGRVLGMLTLPKLVRVSADAEVAKTATSMVSKLERPQRKFEGKAADTQNLSGLCCSIPLYRTRLEGRVRHGELY